MSKGHAHEWIVESKRAADAALKEIHCSLQHFGRLLKLARLVGERGELKQGSAVIAVALQEQHQSVGLIRCHTVKKLK